jgi:signal transduction histidine kinase
MAWKGQEGLAAWIRVFPWEPSQGPEGLQLAAAFIPGTDLPRPAAPAPANLDLTSRLLDWRIFLPLLAALLLPLFLGLWLLRRKLDPLEATARGMAVLEGGGLELKFPEPASAELLRIQQGFRILLDRLRSAEEKTEALPALQPVNPAADSSALEEEAARLETLLKESQGEKAGLEAQLESLKAELARSAERNSPPTEAPAPAPDASSAQAGQEALQALGADLKATLGAVRENLSGAAAAGAAPQQEFLGLVLNRSARLEKLVADLQDLALTAAGSRLELAPTDPGPLCAAQLDAIRPLAEAKQLELEADLEPSLPSLPLHAEKFSQVLGLLLSQAVRVSPSGGRVLVWASTAGGSFELGVADSGQPLSEEKAALVFEAFHAMDSRAGAEFVGTGLRFPVIRALVRAQGGEIRLAPREPFAKAYVISLTLPAGWSRPMPQLPPLEELAPLPALPPLEAWSEPEAGDAEAEKPFLPPLPPVEEAPAPAEGLPPLRTLDDLTGMIQKATSEETRETGQEPQ